MSKTLKTDIALLSLRLCFGGLLIYGHGWGKMMKLMAGGPYEFGDPIGLGPGISLALATFTEVICAFMVLIGWFTRPACIPVILTMLVIIFGVHLHDEFSRQEKAILYLIPYISLFLTGPGWYSIDAQFRIKA